MSRNQSKFRIRFIIRCVRLSPFKKPPRQPSELMFQVRAHFSSTEGGPSRVMLVELGSPPNSSSKGGGRG